MSEQVTRCTATIKIVDLFFPPFSSYVKFSITIQSPLFINFITFIIHLQLLYVLYVNRSLDLNKRDTWKKVSLNEFVFSGEVGSSFVNSIALTLLSEFTLL